VQYGVANQLPQCLFRVVGRLLANRATYDRRTPDVDAHDFIRLAQLVSDRASDLALIEEGSVRLTPSMRKNWMYAQGSSVVAQLRAPG